MSWEIYKGEGDVFSRGTRVITPAVSINKKGCLSLNSTLRNIVGEWKNVQLLFDQTEQKIGIKLVHDDAEHIYHISDNKSSKVMAISAKGFFNFFGIDYSESHRFNASYDNSKRLIIVRLKERIA